MHCFLFQDADDSAIKAASIDILSYIVDFNPSMVREHALQQINKGEDVSSTFCVSYVVDSLEKFSSISLIFEFYILGQTSSKYYNRTDDS